MIVTIPTQFADREVITLARCDDPGPISAKARAKRGGLFKCSMFGGVTAWAYGDEIVISPEVAA